MSEYKIVTVAEQDVCFDDEPRRKFAPMSLVLAVLNHWSDDPENIVGEGGNPKEYTVRVVVEVKEKTKPADRCPDCGYTKEDANIHLDHHLCSNKTPPWEPSNGNGND